MGGTQMYVSERRKGDKKNVGRKLKIAVLS